MTSFRHFPVSHWQKIWLSNSLEQLNAEIKRRTRVFGIFPNDAAVLRLITAGCVEQHDEWSVSVPSMTISRHSLPLPKSSEKLGGLREVLQESYANRLDVISFFTVAVKYLYGLNA